MNRRNAFKTGIGTLGIALVSPAFGRQPDDNEPITPEWYRSEKPDVRVFCTDANVDQLERVIPHMRDGETIGLTLHKVEIKTRGHLRRVIAAIKGE